MPKRKVKVVQPDPAKPVPAEIIADAIVEIGNAMKAFNASRLRREAVVTLIADRSKLSKERVRIVLANLDDLEETYLKPRR